jgi:hypothetical protein
VKQIAKVAAPPVLVTNATEWTSKYLAAASPEERKRHEKWRHPDIRHALKGETNSKCAYCEAFVADVAYPHVEHIVPKSQRPDLAHEWRNLTTACEPCNVYKGDYYDPEYGILDPYDDDAASRLTAFGAFIDWVRGDQQAEITVTKLRLNRLDLVSSRIDRLNHVRSLIERWHDSEGALKATLEQVISVEAREGEFSASACALLRSHRFPL